MRTLVVGDVHGAHRALLQALERAKYDQSADRLIFLGDVADGWPQTKECFDLIVGLKNKVYILGNHDEWFVKWAIDGGYPVPEWWSQGGRATVRSYAKDINSPWQAMQRKNIVPKSHIDLLSSALPYFVDGARIFVHGGFLPHISLLSHETEHFTWDRTLWFGARQEEHFAKVHGIAPPRLTKYEEVFVGHTSTYAYSSIPIKQCEVWNLDQGCGWEGKLSVMDVDTKEYWQSAVVSTLYQNAPGRK